MHSLVHAVKSCQGVHEPQFINRSFHLEKVKAFGFFVGLFLFFALTPLPHTPLRLGARKWLQLCCLTIELK